MHLGISCQTLLSYLFQLNYIFLEYILEYDTLDILYSFSKTIGVSFYADSFKQIL